MNTSSPIPQCYIDLCGEFAKLARAAGLRSMTVTLDPRYGSLSANWNDRIVMSWDSGRHEDSVHKFTLSSTVMVAATVDEPKRESTPSTSSNK